MPGDGGRPASRRAPRSLRKNRSRAVRWVAPLLLLGLAGCASDDVSGLTAEKRTLLPGSTVGTPSLPAGTSEWRVYDSGLVAVTDAAAAAAMPVISAKGGMRGTAYFDLVTVTEYRPDGTEKQQLVYDGFSSDTVVNWHSWSSKGSSEPKNLVREPKGYQDDASLSVANAEDAEAVVGWSNDGHLFKVTPGNKYRIRGYMRGEDIALLSGGTEIRFHLDVYAKK
jgi:endoglucanase